LSGLHTGGRCFGYRNVPIEDPTRVDQHGRTLITGVRLEVREDQAAVVQRIFTMYAGGNSLQKIAKHLNAEGVISPQPQKGRISRSWCPSSIRTILRNDRYRSVLCVGKNSQSSLQDREAYLQTHHVRQVGRPGYSRATHYP
jgi:site-specific DNA recombinase